jgi:hypothetical protein
MKAPRDPQKQFGDASLHPRTVRFNFLGRLTSSSFWLSSWLPFYSPPNFLIFHASFAGGARIQFTCIVTPICLVKRKVSDRRQKNGIENMSEVNSRGRSREKIARASPQAGSSAHKHRRTGEVLLRPCHSEYNLPLDARTAAEGKVRTRRRGREASRMHLRGSGEKA